MFFAFCSSEPCANTHQHAMPHPPRSATHRTLVAVARDGVSRLLSVRLLGLRLRGARGRVGLALERVADVLGRRLLRVGLERGAGLVGDGLAADCEGRWSAGCGCGAGARSRSDMVLACVWVGMGRMQE
jgi:hypothetical protein